MSVTTNPTVEPVALTEPQRVTGWRLSEFLRFGVEPDLASRLAVSPVDLRRFERMLAEGCPVNTAVEILL